MPSPTRPAPRSGGIVADRDFEALSPVLKRAARWLREHPRDAGVRSMRECARRAGVGPATMTRLAQALGHDGYEAMRAPMRDALLRGQGDYAARAEALQRRRADAAPWLDTLADAHLANVSAVIERNSRAELEAAARAMLAARTVAILGLRVCHGVAWQLHYTCRLMAGNARLLTGAGGILGDEIDALGERDALVAISMAPYTRATVDAATQCARRKVRVIAITDATLSPIARVARHTLAFRADAPSFFQSLVGVTALVEALGATIAAIGGAPVLAHLRERQAQLAVRDAYWERPVRGPEPVPG
ncbi:hypothetical protein BURK1_00523 [Burkholderiales bacterium]|nr:hypothetical protein BURK1_00523 [Burkholderiales bacterium]